MNMLIVNDIRLEADTMRADIDWASYNISHVFCAYSSDDAKAVISKETIDILLSDIEMPGESGLTLINWILENKYDIDCILLTCHADFSYAREGLSLGCQDYILLPASYETIGNAVFKAVTRRMRRLEDERLKDYGKVWLKSHSESIPYSTSEPKKNAKDISDKCAEYILSHLSDEDLTVAGVAAQLFVDPIHLNRIFKKERGLNISQFIIKERMEYVGMLLRTTDHTPTDISLQAGYANYPYFCTVFKKYYGCTPTQYINDTQKHSV